MSEGRLAREARLAHEDRAYLRLRLEQAEKEVRKQKRRAGKYEAAYARAMRRIEQAGGRA